MISAEYLAKVYPSSYAQARERILEAAKAAGNMSIETFADPSGEMANGTPLACDAIRFGAKDARRVFVMMSGTHGIEGISGSAAQLDWIVGGGPARLPANTSVLIVHAANPWGWQHNRRRTRDRVDLNRNFIDHDGANVKDDPLFLEYIVDMPDEMSEEYLQGYADRRAMLIEKYGAQRFSDLQSAGQYSYPDQVFFAGARPDWVNAAFRSLISKHSNSAERLAFIDWHYGAGPYQKPRFVVFHPADSDRFAAACRWWGREAVTAGTEAVEKVPTPKYRGTTSLAVQQEASAVQPLTAMVEFGTVSYWDIIRAIIIDSWLGTGKAKSSPNYSKWEAIVRETFAPSGAEWRAAVLTESRQIYANGIAGLADW